MLVLYAPFSGHSNGFSLAGFHVTLIGRIEVTPEEQRIQKAVTQMNVQLANVISDVSGLTGQTIVRAIVAGERDPIKL